MKKLIAFFMAAVMLISCTAVGATPRDVQRHWSGNAVNTLIVNGVLTGYEDGTFKPDQYLTREEAAVLFYRFLKIKNPDMENIDKGFMNTVWLADVDNSRWSAEAIKYFVSRYILAVNDDGTFKPRAYLTRADAAVMIHSYSKDLFPVNSYPTFPDTDSEIISTVAGQGIISGYEDGTFRPFNSITRGEFAQLMSCICGFDIVPADVTLPEMNVISVPYISQLYPVYAVVGCEATSLLMGLKAKGYASDIGLRTFLDAMPKSASDPAKGFVGSPYVADTTKKTRTTIYPPILSEYASQYGNVTDFSGSTPEALQAEVLDGNPVVAYCTMHWEKPFYRYYNIEGTTQRLLSNNHVILVCGYDMNTDRYYIADPYNEYNIYKDYFYWVDAWVFEPIYNERRHAIVVR